MNKSKMKCNQCNKPFYKYLDGSIKLIYFDKKLYFCSHKCHHKYVKENYYPYWKWIKKNPNFRDPDSITITISPNITNTGYFRKEYDWLIKDMKELISKKDAIQLYNSEREGFDIFFGKMEKDYPKLYKYYRKTADEEGLAYGWLLGALREIGGIEED